MENWITIIIIVIAVAIVIGNLSTVQKNAKQPLRKKGLNDLEETLPRTNKTSHTLDNSTPSHIRKPSDNK